MYPRSFEYFAPATLDEALAILERLRRRGEGPRRRAEPDPADEAPLRRRRRALVDINRHRRISTRSREDGRRPADRRARPAQGVRALGAPARALRRARRRGAADLRPDRAQPRHGLRLARARRPAGRLGLGDARRRRRGRRARRRAASGRSRSTSSSTGRSRPRSQPNEIVTEVRVPDPGPRAGGTYLKLERKVGDFATVAVAVHVSLLDDGTVGAGRDRAHRRRADEHPARRRPRRRSPAPRSTTRRSREAARLAAEAAQPHDDLRGTAEYKRNVVRVFTERGLRTRADREERCAEATAVRGGARWTTHPVTVTVNGEPRSADVEPRLLLVHFLRETLGLTGHARRLRHDELRRVHRPARRRAGEVVHVLRRPGRRPRGHDRRGPGAGRRAAPDPGGLQRGARPPVRLLHARDDARRRRRSSRRTRTRARRRSAGRSPGTSAAAPATRTSSRPCSAPPRKHRGRRSDGDDRDRERAGSALSVKRKEDERFIRGRGNYVDDVMLPGMLHLAILRSPFAHARINSIDTSRRAGAAGRRRRRHRRAAGAAQPRLDADALRRHAGRARDRQGALPGPGGRGVIAEDPYIAKDALELIDVDYEPLPAVTTPQQALEDGAPLIRDDKEGQTDNRDLPLGGRRQGGDRPRLRRGRPGRQPRHLLPALPPGAARVLRLRRRRQPGDRQDDDLHDLAGAARAPDAVRARRRAAGAQDPDHLAGHRRRLRQQGADLPRLRRRDGGVAPDRPARSSGSRTAPAT